MLKMLHNQRSIIQPINTIYWFDCSTPPQFTWKSQITFHSIIQNSLKIDIYSAYLLFALEIHGKYFDFRATKFHIFHREYVFGAYERSEERKNETAKFNWDHMKSKILCCGRNRINISHSSWDFVEFLHFLHISHTHANSRRRRRETTYLFDGRLFS